MSPDSRFEDMVRSHFVAITGSYVVLGDDGKPGLEKDFAFSGFVIVIEGVWCLLTAGHVIAKIKAVVSHPKMKLIRVGLMDYFSLQARTKEPTPFDFDAEHVIHVDKHGIDFGMIPLRPFYQSSLQANGITPLPTAGWRGYEVPKCDDYGLLGLPEEEIDPIEATESHSSGVRVKLVYVQLSAEAVPSIDPAPKIPRFAARLADGGQLGSAVGMSGGPIIGFRKLAHGGWEYACVAIQGSWDPAHRMVFGTPAGIIVHTTEQLLAEAKRK